MNTSLLKAKNRILYSDSLTAICPVTGISISLNLPKIPLLLTYSNPLSSMDNCLRFAKLPYSEQSKLPTEVIAGVLLTILTHYSLIEDKLSAIERNALLSEVPPYYLCKAISFILSYSRKKISLFHSISLEQVSKNEGTSLDLIKSFLENNAKLFAIETPTSTSYVEYKEKKTKLLRTVSITSELRKQAKELVSKIAEQGVMNNKFHSILKVVCQGNNLATVHKELRMKIVSKLLTFGTTEATQLAELIKTADNNATVQEKIEQTSAPLERASDSFTKKPSLAEILAKKLNKPELISNSQKADSSTQAEGHPDQPTINNLSAINSNNNEEEVEAELPFPHSNCADCLNSKNFCLSVGFCEVKKEQTSLNEFVDLLEEAYEEYNDEHKEEGDEDEL